MMLLSKPISVMAAAGAVTVAVDRLSTPSVEALRLIRKRKMEDSKEASMTKEEVAVWLETEVKVNPDDIAYKNLVNAYVDLKTLVAMDVEELMALGFKKTKALVLMKKIKEKTIKAKKRLRSQAAQIEEGQMMGEEPESKRQKKPDEDDDVEPVVHVAVQKLSNLNQISPQIMVLPKALANRSRLLRDVFKVDPLAGSTKEEPIPVLSTGIEREEYYAAALAKAIEYLKEVDAQGKAEEEFDALYDPQRTLSELAPWFYNPGVPHNDLKSNRKNPGKTPGFLDRYLTELGQKVQKVVSPPKSMGSGSSLVVNTSSGDSLVDAGLLGLIDVAMELHMESLTKLLGKYVAEGCVEKKSLQKLREELKVSTERDGGFFGWSQKQFESDILPVVENHTFENYTIHESELDDASCPLSPSFLHALESGPNRHHFFYYEMAPWLSRGAVIRLAAASKEIHDKFFVKSTGITFWFQRRSGIYEGAATKEAWAATKQAYRYFSLLDDLQNGDSDKGHCGKSDSDKDKRNSAKLFQNLFTSKTTSKNAISQITLSPISLLQFQSTTQMSPSEKLSLNLTLKNIDHFESSRCLRYVEEDVLSFFFTPKVSEYAPTRSLQALQVLMAVDVDNSSVDFATKRLRMEWRDMLHRLPVKNAKSLRGRLVQLAEEKSKPSLPNGLHAVIKEVEAVLMESCNMHVGLASSEVREREASLNDRVRKDILEFFFPAKVQQCFRDVEWEVWRNELKFHRGEAPLKEKGFANLFYLETFMYWMANPKTLKTMQKTPDQRQGLKNLLTCIQPEWKSLIGGLSKWSAAGLLQSLKYAEDSFRFTEELNGDLEDTSAAVENGNLRLWCPKQHAPNE